MANTITDTIVRHEYFGPLVWSGAHNSYFIAKDGPDTPLVADAVGALRSGRSLDAQGAIPQTLLLDLSELAVDATAQHIDSPYSDRLSGPLECYFDYTWLCNLAKHKCGQDSFCYAADFLGPTTMREEKVRQFMAELGEWGVMRVHLAGGEPTINKKGLANYLDSATAAGLFSSMPTNGVLVDDEIIDIILRNTMKSVSFSIDGSTAERFAQVRGPGLFDRVLANFRRFVERKNAEKSDVKACVKPTYEPTTPRSELRDLVLMAIDLGADQIKFANPERCLRHEKGHYGKTVDEYYDNMQYITELQETYRDYISITNANNPVAGCQDVGIPGLEGCIGGQELLTLNPDGSVTPCLMHHVDLGNVLHDYSTLREFWDKSTVLPEFWSALKKPSGCNGCDIYSKCRSGSTTRRIVQIGRFNADKTTGDFAEEYDPLCPRDYMARHPEVKLGKPKPAKAELHHFKEVSILHSL